MSLDLYQREGQERLAEMRPVTNPEPGMFDGFVRGVGLSTMRGFARAASGLDLAGAVGPIAQDAILGSGTEAQDRYFREHDDVYGSAVKHWTPEPNEVGAAADVVGGLLSTLPLVILSPGLAVAATQLGTGEELIEKGVPAGKAQAVGAVQGAGLGLGVWMPILGQSGWQRVFIGGAGFNVAQGLALRGASGAILEGTPAADEFKAFDGKALTLDVLLGMAFGSIAHLSPAQRAQGAAYWERIGQWAEGLDPSKKDAIAAVRQSQHLNVDSAPGKLAGPQDIQAHADRLRTAVDQLAKGDQVAVDDLPKPAFEPDERRAAAAEKQVAELQKTAEKVRKDEGLAPFENYPVNQDLVPEHQQVERNFFRQLEDFDSAMKAYEKHPETDGGKIISTDIARELSPDYNASKESRAALALAVHEPASALVKKIYTEKLKEPSESGLNMVTFTAGGTGAGKTSAISGVPLAAKIAEVSDIVYDTNFNTFSSAASKVDQALAAGKQVNIVYVGRDPVDALVNGAIPRAVAKGRTVPLIEHARTHRGTQEAIPQLMEKYAGDSRVQFVFIDNSRGRGNAAVATSDLVKSFNLDQLESRLEKALNDEHAAGRVPDFIYRGFARRDPGAAPETAAGEPGKVRGGAGAPVVEPERLQVFRVGEAGGLARRNAGDLEGVASYLQRLDDLESPASSQASQISAYETAKPEKFGRYVGFAKEQAQLPFVLEQRVHRGEITREEAERTVGAHEPGMEVLGKEGKGGAQYSFPAGTEAKPLASVPIERVRDILYEQTGIHGFDNASTEQVAGALKTAFADQLRPPKAEAPAAGEPGGAEPPPPRGSAGKKAAGAEAPDPVMLEAQRLVDERPDLTIPVGTNEKGETVSMSVKDFLERARTEAAQLHEEAKLVQIAAQCMMGVA